MESIAGTRECEEAEEGCALRTRDASVAILSESEKVSGLGPPDMCIVNKTSTSYYTSDTLETTSFHYVLGLRVENAASLAAYFAKLTRNQEQAFFLSSLVQTQSWKIKGGTYCCYDAFSGCDVRCQVRIPGGVITKAVTGSGEEMEVDETIWKGALISSFMRTTMLIPNLSSEIPNAAVLPSHERFPCSLQEEKLLIHCIMHLMELGRIQQVRDRLHYDSSKGSKSIHLDVLSLSLLNHFMHVQRVSVLQNIFHRWVRDHDDSIQAIYEANCMSYLGKAEEAVQCLQDCLALTEQKLGGRVEDYGEIFSPLHTAIAELCADLQGEGPRPKEMDLGFKSALKAVDLDPSYRPARMALTKLHVLACFDNPNSLENFKGALLALNQIQPPHDTEEIEDILVLIPQWSRMLEPRDNQADVDRVIVDKLKEDFEDYGREKLMQLPGSILVPHRLILHEDYYVFNFASITRRDIYLILVEIVAELDWEPFLQLRAETFFMESLSDSEEEESESEDLNPGDVAVDIREEDEIHEMDVRNQQGESIVCSGSSNGEEDAAMGSIEKEKAINGEEGTENVSPNEVGKDSASENQNQEGESADEEACDPVKEKEEETGGAGNRNGRTAKEGVPVEEEVNKLQISERKDGVVESPTGSEGESKAKAVCSIWLDEMIHALYSDLAEYVEFRVHIKNIKQTIDNDFEVPDEYDTEFEDDGGDQDTDEEVSAMNMFSGNKGVAADWFRRGILAERILREDEAERSHRAALNSQFKMISSLTLLRFYAEGQQVKQACEMATQILRELHPGVWKDPTKHVNLPFLIQDAFFYMIARSGLQAVRRAQQQVGGKCPAAITEIFHQAVEWHIAGFAH